jgi:GNAT superfamily N-acetyltransferase
MATLLQMPDINGGPVSIRPLQDRDLVHADRIFRLAFGTFLGLPNPETFAGDADYVRTRWLADPTAALGAEVNGSLVGSNFVTQWGSVGFFGPLTVHPSLWDHGIAKKLLVPTINMMEGWQVTHAGLYTFGQSAKHVALYQKFDFWPRFLTMIMSKTASARGIAAQVYRFAGLRPDEKARALKECREVTDSVYPGLDVEREIRAVDDQQLGDTILLMDNSQLAGFAVCHCGAGSEAGSGTCYVKFAAVRSHRAAEQQFEQLLKSCENFAAMKGTTRLVAGVNTSRSQAYRSLLAQGFRTELQGIVMQRGNDAGYNREGIYLIDDWR